METSSHNPIALVSQEVKKLWLKLQTEWVHHNYGDGKMAPNASDEKNQTVTQGRMSGERSHFHAHKTEASVLLDESSEQASKVDKRLISGWAIVTPRCGQSHQNNSK